MISISRPLAGWIRRIAPAAVLAAGALIPWSGAVAQPYQLDGRVHGTVEGGGLRLAIYFDRLPWASSWSVTPAGVDVYRRSVGPVCGAWERVTDEPVPWTWVDGDWFETQMSFEILDTSAQPATAYLYLARAVDAGRNPIPANPDEHLGAASHGVAYLGRGLLYGGDGGCGESQVQWLEMCGPACNAIGRFTAAPEVAVYVNSGTPVAVYGTIAGYHGFCGVYETVGYLSSAVPTGCIVATEEKTWGQVKSLYR